MNKIVRAASISVLALAIGVSAVACGASPKGAADASAATSAAQSGSSTGSETGAKSKAEAKKTLDAFFVQIGNDLPIHLANTTNTGPRTSEDDAALFRKSFEKSIAYLKPGSFTPEKERLFIGSFAGALYGVDSAAKYEAKESGFRISGDTATIDTDQFAVTMMGKTEDTSANGADKKTFTLTFVDGKWLVSGFSGV